MCFRHIVSGVGLVIEPGPSARQTDPQELAAEAITALKAVVDDLKDIVTWLEKEEDVAV